MPNVANKLLRAVLSAAFCGLILAGAEAFADPSIHTKPITVAPDTHRPIAPSIQGDQVARSLFPSISGRESGAEDSTRRDPHDTDPLWQFERHFAAGLPTLEPIIWDCGDGMVCCADPSHPEACAHFAAACEKNGSNSTGGAGLAVCYTDDEIDVGD